MLLDKDLAARWLIWSLHRPPPLAFQWQWRRVLQVTWGISAIRCPVVATVAELRSKYLITRLGSTRKQKRMNQPWRHRGGDTHAAKEFARSLCSFPGLVHCKLGKYRTATWNWGVCFSFSLWQICWKCYANVRIYSPYNENLMLEAEQSNRSHHYGHIPQTVITHRLMFGPYSLDRDFFLISAKHILFHYFITVIIFVISHF